MRLVLLGPPGAGKGTQAALLRDKLGVPHVATGDIFRSNIAEGTELGVLAKVFIDRGDLVPDEVVIAMVTDRLTADDCADGFLLDGFPRTAPQAEALDRRLQRPSVPQEPLDAALNFEIDEDELFRRLMTRATQQHRSDDTAEIVRHRFQVFRTNAAALAAHYEQQGLLVRVDGTGTIDEVNCRIVAALERLAV
jgi:adenylate kinase